MSPYYLRGAVPLDSASYVARGFEQQTLQNTLADRWVLLLGPRQHGKTTGLIRIKNQLQDAGLPCAIVDLQAMPPCDQFEAVVVWFCSEVASEFGIEFAQPQDPNSRRQLETCLELAVPARPGPVVIVVDEASGIHNKEWRNSFYGQIRAIANQKALEAPDHFLRRLRFIFSGSFRPEGLVDDLNSPFNVCELVVTEDITLDDAVILQDNVEGTSNRVLLETIFEEVGGHPYLVQFMLSRMLGGENLETAIGNLTNGNIDHFNSVFGNLIAEPHLIEIVSRIIRDGSVHIEPGNPDFQFLQVIGIARREGNTLVFRNNLYAEFARTSPQLNEGPLVENRHNPLLIPIENSFVFMQSIQLREIAYSLELGAVRAFNAGNFRLALCGFGASFEALLIDYLESKQPADLTAAVGRANPRFDRRFENPDSPRTWRLAFLIGVTRQTVNGLRIADPPATLREWRNLIHPGNALQNYIAETDLGPECFTSTGLLSAAKREIARVI